MKKGRKKDHIWRFVKYLGDAAIYAKCSCGYRYIYVIKVLTGRQSTENLI